MIEEEDLLPDDLLANVLGRLPPCSLAASRCVRKNWCAIIDSRCLLRADLLPLRLHGFFCFTEEPRIETYFFSRPFSTFRGFLEDDLMILDHCNGLLLLWERVANPATRESVPLPPFPKTSVHRVFFLAYDPMVSPHYEVLLFPLVPSSIDVDGDNTKTNDITFNEDSEWPPSPFTTHVFSSRKWRWEERSFVREAGSAGTIAYMHYDCRARLRHAVYLRGVLYVHCQNDLVMRITFSSDKYRMIKSPLGNQGFDQGVSHLGKSEKGLYFALLSQHNRWPWFRVWLLNESCGQMEWVLKCDTSLQAVVENFPIDHTDRYDMPWTIDYKKDVSEALAEGDESEWDFHSGIVLHETKDKVAECYDEMVFLGFHPYKEIAFLLVSYSTVVSYHLNSSKVQALGMLHEPIAKSFPYTPCWMWDLFGNNRLSN